LADHSREREFNGCVQEKSELYFHHPVDDEENFKSEVEVWTHFFDFMHYDGGIMSHINTLMQEEHERLVHEWKHVVGHTHKMEQLIRNVQRFRMLCKDFRIQDREYDCSTSNFLVEKPRGLTLDEHPFFMTARMIRKLRICGGNYSVIELRDKYELLENFLLHDGPHFRDTFKLGSSVVWVRSIRNRERTVKIEVRNPNFRSTERMVSCKPQLNLNSNSSVLEVTNFDPSIANFAEIKLVGRLLSCLKHMSNYEDDEAQFGVIDQLCKVGCDNFIVAQSPSIREILEMQPPDDVVLVDLSKLSDVPLIFGGNYVAKIEYVTQALE
jgi:hypothetical protein